MAQSINGYLAQHSRALLQAAIRAPMLEKQRELDLARRWRDERDEAALADLTRSYLRLVIAIAGRYRSYGLPLSDLVQEGSVGLMEAAARFEPEREIRFSTYASWWIRSSMQDFILRNWSIVRTGTTAAHKTLFFNFRRLRAQIANEHANEHAGDHTRPHDGPIGPAARTEVARRLRVRPKDVEVMEARLSGTDRSLNAHVGEDGEAQWQDFLTCEAPLPDEVVMTRHDGQLRARLIAEAMETLDERESTIIRERRLSDDTVTLAALGHRLGISKERVRQIESQALAKLRSALVARVGDPATAGLTPTV